MQPLSLKRKKLNKFLDTDQTVVDKLIYIHRTLEPNFDVFDDKTGKTASFVVLVRGLSLLSVTNDLLRNGNSSEAQILYRTIHEANFLSLYFIFSDRKNENVREIDAWFKKGINIQLKKIRDYASDINEVPQDYFNQLFMDYSRLLHHTYKSMMESYKHYYNFSPIRAKEKREGFNYYTSPLFGNVVYEEYLNVVHEYQNLIHLTLMTFDIVFSMAQNLLDLKSIKFISNQLKYYNSPLKTKLQIHQMT